MWLKILIAAVAVLALFTGWQTVVLHNAYIDATQAPQGQSVGPADAKITIVEFMDYRCAPCRSLNTVVQTTIARHPDVRFVFRHLPVYEKPSVHEAQIALAAGKQGKFMAMHEILISRSEPVQDAELPSLCAQAGVDCDRLQREMHGHDIADTLLMNLRLAKLLHIEADPTFMIGRTMYNPNHRLPTVADFDGLIADMHGAAPVTTTDGTSAAAPAAGAP